MDCPKAYNNKQFMQNVINPALKELQNYFTDLQCIVKYARKRGNPVDGYMFTFKPEQPSKVIPTDTQPMAAEQSLRTPSKSQGNYKSKNKFNQFQQREMTQEELDALEAKLLQQNLTIN